MSSVKVMNQGKRKITFGNGPNESVKPGGVVILNKEIADRNLKLYPKELIDLDNVKPDYEQEEVKDFSKTAESDASEENAEEATTEKPKGGKAKGGKASDDDLAAALNKK